MSDEQEDIGLSMTINDELRLCGMTGDDEDDIVGDAKELFGRRAAEELNGGTATHPLTRWTAVPSGTARHGLECLVPCLGTKTSITLKMFTNSSTIQ